jgi:tetratricopeptide (TPR) repeat protein
MIQERALRFVQRGDLRSCAEKCEELLALAPDFVPPRNNLAIAYFQTGREAEAVVVLEDTRKLAPDNRFAEATLAKLYFLTGREQESREIAKHLVTDPPTDPDPLTATLETLAYLGNDEDVDALATQSIRKKVGDKRSLAMQHHFLAYAKCRLGDETGARSHWKKCLAIIPDHPDARENLRDLDTAGGHAPWPDSFGKWISNAQLERAVQCLKRGDYQRPLAELPALAALIPALLDRGDPDGREFASKMAMLDSSPPLVEALLKFALGSRGPDKLRFDVLTYLKRTDVVDVGPHRFYSNGKWTNVFVFDAQITPEPENLNYSERVWEMLNEGVAAQKAKEFDRAEAIFQDVLAEDPTNASAIYNTCVIWLNRDGRQGRVNAIERLRKLQQESPKYLMAPIALAQMAGEDGDFKTAHDLLTSVFKARTLNHMEAVSLFVAQIDVALYEKNVEAAQIAFKALVEIADPDDPRLDHLSRRIKLAKSKNPLKKLLSGW